MDDTQHGDQDRGGLSSALAATEEPIPQDVYWSEERNYFYDIESGEKKPAGFYNRWYPYRAQFAQERIVRSEPTTSLQQTGVEENDRVEATISSDLARQELILQTVSSELAKVFAEKVQIVNDKVDLDEAYRIDCDSITTRQVAADAREAELLLQRDEALHRIDLYGQMQHAAEMAKLRRAVR
jgi:hypothetical protein